MTLPMVRRLPHVGLAPRLVALAVLVAGLVGGTVAVSVISSARTALRDQILATHLVLAEVMAGKMAGYVSDVRGDASDLAQRSAVVVALERNDFSSLDARLAEWLASREGKIDGLALYSIDGTMLATSQGNRSLIGLASVNAGAIQRVAATDKPDQGQPHYCPGS